MIANRMQETTCNAHNQRFGSSTSMASATRQNYLESSPIFLSLVTLSQTRPSSTLFFKTSPRTQTSTPPSSTSTSIFQPQRSVPGAQLTAASMSSLRTTTVGLLHTGRSSSERAQPDFERASMPPTVSFAMIQISQPRDSAYTPPDHRGDGR